MLVSKSNESKNTSVKTDKHRRYIKWTIINNFIKKKPVRDISSCPYTEDRVAVIALKAYITFKANKLIYSA